MWCSERCFQIKSTNLESVIQCERNGTKNQQNNNIEKIRKFEMEQTILEPN